MSRVATADDHAAAFEAVKSYCQARGHGEIDSKPKNTNCLCFISFDPGAILKDATPLHWGPLPESPAHHMGKLRIENNQKGAVSSKAAKARQTQQPEEFDGNLSDWLGFHDVTIHDIRHGPCQGGTAEMLLVTCPWDAEHTQDFGAKDTAVFEDPTGGKWCFNCFHAYCEGRGWEDYRQAVAPRETYQPRRKPYTPTRRRLYRDRQLYGRKS